MGLFDIFKKKNRVDSPEESLDQEEGLANPADQESVDKSAPANDGQTEEEPKAATEETSVTQATGDSTDSKDQFDPMQFVITEEETPGEIEIPASQSDKVDDVAESVKSGNPDESEKTTAEAYDQGLSQSRKGFAQRFNQFLANFRSVDEDFFEQLEDTLIGADLGFDLSIQISNQVREAVKERNIKDKAEIQALIIEKMVNQYEEQGQNEDQSMHFAPAGQPTVILFVGVNGVGKTTTVGKLASTYKQEGKKVLLAAADTFRAGAVKQLQEWGTRDGVPVVAGPEKADPASVVYTAVEKAKNENYDVLFVDTAGRLQNNVNLMNELAKMNRVIQKVLPEAPQEVLLVLDATTGQNALQQAKLFQNSSDVTGIVLTKMDGTAKGGIVFAIRDSLHLPVKWIGFGEKATDLRVFSAEDFVYGLFKDLVQE
ncbi:signal recognition particle-docking protein FtsY [Fructobacillus ficulneus]|uniref:Signal recognition particle receptor FtsY n=1 Tax=Fructobacillus ficulneus TaxID=157463 RepID=A0A0K8MJ30_9LACO|nr:signal recognition particle-docking protein FtsY [Fructobacillus ficulneus]GAP00577.1 signal recognition particle-docking protein FtsY [Fructobacillus ficulneus]